MPEPLTTSAFVIWLQSTLAGFAASSVINGIVGAAIGLAIECSLKEELTLSELQSGIVAIKTDLHNLKEDLKKERHRDFPLGLIDLRDAEQMQQVDLKKLLVLQARSHFTAALHSAEAANDWQSKKNAEFFVGLCYLLLEEPGVAKNYFIASYATVFKEGESIRQRLKNIETNMVVPMSAVSSREYRDCYRGFQRDKAQYIRLIHQIADLNVFLQPLASILSKLDYDVKPAIDPETNYLYLPVLAEPTYVEPSSDCNYSGNEEKTYQDYMVDFLTCI